MWNFITGHIRFHIRPHEFVRTYNYMGRTCKNMFSDVGKHCPVILPLFLQVILLCFCLFHFVAFLAVTLFGGTRQGENKKGYLPRQPIFC